MMKNVFITFLLFLVISLCNAQKTERIYLSGTDVETGVEWDFICSAGQRSGKWQKIKVPSCWEQQGFGAYTYGRFYKNKDAKPSDEYGHYRTSFCIGNKKADACFRLVFEGVMTDTRVLIDGKQVGKIHQGGFTEFTYDITDYVTPGKKQVLEVFVNKESANNSVNSAERRADWWLFGGIYRPVYIDILPKEHIEHVSIDARANGEIYTDVKATSRDEVALYVDGKRLVYNKDKGCYIFMNPKTWDPEHPHLYKATFVLGNNKHIIEQKIGFRTLEFREHDGIYLNGMRLVVKGTNRHCFHPETGRALSPDMSLNDARLIKQMNMNAVRCHYPSDRHFLEICDSLGLLYIDELPGWQTHYDDSTAVRMLHEFVSRDVNHPCVFIWSNGNEGGWNVSIDHLFSKLDLQKRKVIHPWADYDGIDTHHYPAYQTGAYRMHNGQNVFMPTEFLHGKYDKGQGAALEDMWSHWTRSPLFAGGFIWAYVDEAVRRTDYPTGRSKGLSFGNKKFNIKDCILDSDGGNGPDGCMDPYRQPEASFYTIREVWSPIYIDRLNITNRFDGRILVENRYLFTNLSECSMRYAIKDINGRAMKEGNVTLPPIGPNERGYAKLEVPADYLDGDIFEVKAYDANGEEVCTWSEPIHRAEEQIYLSLEDATTPDADEVPEVIPVGMSKIERVKWFRLSDGRLYLDAHILYNEKAAALTDESKWQIGVSFRYPEDNVDSVRWVGRGPYRVWKNRLKGQQFGMWTLAYNNTVTGEYNSPNPPLYPEFKGYRSDLRWVEIINKDKSRKKITTLTNGLYLRLFTPEEAIDQTPGEMGGLQEGKTPKSERTMVAFPDGDISFLLSIPPMQSYKPLEQLGPFSQPDNIRIKSGDEGFHIRLIFENQNN